MDAEPTAYRITDPGVRALFSESARIQSWLDVKAALALAEAELDIIPESATDKIIRKARFENLNLDNIHEGLARTGHPIVWELDRVCEVDAGDYCALGRHHPEHHPDRQADDDPPGPRHFSRPIRRSPDIAGRPCRCHQGHGHAGAHPWPACGSGNLWLQGLGVD